MYFKFTSISLSLFYRFHWGWSLLLVVYQDLSDVHISTVYWDWCVLVVSLASDIVETASVTCTFIVLLCRHGETMHHSYLPIIILSLSVYVALRQVMF